MPPLCCYCALGRGWKGLGALDNGSSEAPVVVRRPKLKRRWQWSKGDGPGEYGGPPIRTSETPVKMWGKPILHPLDEKDDYIWNKDWRPFFKDDEKIAETSQKTEQKQASGFLSLSRVMDIDRVDVDLTKELLKPMKKEETPPEPKVESGKRRWLYAPTRKERKNWERAKKAAESKFRDTDEDALVSGSVEERQRYKQLASNLQVYTLSIGAAGTTCAFVLYSPEAALSYGIGLLGSFVYIRMLASSVEGLGRGDARGAVKGAIGQPRLLVPVILTMAFNRWNDLLVPEYGLVQLQLIPMLVGFFTYKIATVVQVIQDTLPELGFKED